MLTRSSESIPRSSTSRLSAEIGTSAGIRAMARTESDSSACKFRSIMVPSLKDQRVVGAAEAEGGAQHDPQRCGAGAWLRHVVEVEIGVGEVVDRRRDQARLQGADARRRLDR